MIAAPLEAAGVAMLFMVPALLLARRRRRDGWPRPTAHAPRSSSSFEIPLRQPMSLSRRHPESDRSRTWPCGAALVALLAVCSCTTGGGGLGRGTGNGGSVAGSGGGNAGGAGGMAGAGTGGLDAAAPCDPTLCTMPPAAKCQEDSNDVTYSAVSYTGTPTCNNREGCIYPASTEPCEYGCYLGQCTAALASLGNVQGTDAGGSVSLNGGGVAANTVVTVTARTSPRGAAHTVELDYGTCTASTLCVMTSFTFMTLDPNTPAGQTSYDQWTANLAGKSSGTKLAFQLQATGAGTSAISIISQASTGVPWSYTSN